MASSQRYFFDAKSKKEFITIMDNLVITKDKYFGNARAVRQIVNDIITTQNLRLASENNAEITTKKMNTITFMDVRSAFNKLNQKELRSRQIGF